MIEIRGLRKSFGEQLVLQHIDLTLPPGRLHGLVGANGAGKTTLLHCLYGLHPDYSGTIRETTGLSIRQHTGCYPMNRTSTRALPAASTWSFACRPGPCRAGSGSLELPIGVTLGPIRRGILGRHEKEAGPAGFAGPELPLPHPR
ncbi:ATP-binding cassette domain-containing protein [Hymenobacter sp. 5516J-16]|uniref:ATP-binding cassette domain-containing protein n=1 Tax=Hymenobacter sp. 5516J-16 TaxID=2932253 RepID=UPI00397D7D1D